MLFLRTQNNQFGLQGLEVDYVEGTNIHSQGNQQHGRADTGVENKINSASNLVLIVAAALVSV